MRCEQCVKYDEEYNQCEIACDFVLPTNECKIKEFAEKHFKIK